MVFACRQLFPRRGIRFLIEAVARLKPRFPDLKLVLAGDGFEWPELAHLAADLGIERDVTFLDWVPNTELPPYYANRFSERDGAAVGLAAFESRLFDQDCGGVKRQ